MDTKKCSKCVEVKPVREFYKVKALKSGYDCQCKMCHNKYTKAFRTNNKEYSSDYYYKNKDKIAEYQKEHYEKNKDEINKYNRLYRKERAKSNKQYKISTTLRARIYRAIKDQHSKKSYKSIELLGCDIPFVIDHIEKQFTDGMSWDNYGYYSWHIDHIKPCASFDLTDPEQQKECFHYSNLQPLWAYDNLSKGDKYQEAI